MYNTIWYGEEGDSMPYMLLSLLPTSHGSVAKIR